MKKTALLLLVAIGLIGNACADAITYYGIGDNISGSLGGFSFSNAAYKITLPSNTTNIFSGVSLGYPFPIYSISGVTGVGSIEIAGVGTATFANALGIASYDMRSFGGSGSTGFRLDDGSVGSLPQISGNFDAWDLTAPYSFTAPLDSIPLNVNMGTSMGNLLITGLSGNITFTTESVPEPSTYALFGLGALALVIAYRRKVA